MTGRQRKSVKKSDSPAPGSLVPAKNGGSIRHGSLPGNTPGTGRPRSEVKALAGAKLPKHVTTLDGIADGISRVTLRETCPQCGYENPYADTALPMEVRAGERVRAVEALAKLADPKELVITGDRAGAFFDCVYRAIVEECGEEVATVVQARAIQLMSQTT